MREVEAVARTLGLTVVTVESIENIAPGFQAREDRADMFGQSAPKDTRADNARV